MRLKSLQLSGVGPFTDTTIEFPAGDNGELADMYLLVGQNGCGKTTALHAIATMLDPESTRHLRWSQRLAKEGSAELVVTVEGVEQVVQWSLSHSSNWPAFRADIPSLAPWRRTVNGSSADQALAWAAFAYSGLRNFEHVQVSAIAEQTGSPLQGSLNFFSSANTHALAQWIANQQFKRFKALDGGLADRARSIEDSIRRIETAIRDVVGVDFRFHTTVDDLNVQAELNGTVVDFGLLPEGVKSIVSWIADLLMRMDRTPWKDNLPVHQREFLLLLDEIDVHLHPAWQRKLLPVVQKLFPKAQIIASTHSPFVVASLADGAVIELRLDANGKSTAQPPVRAPLSMSYSATLRELFGITSDFDLETEKALKDFQETRTRVLKGEPGAQAELERRADELKTRGEEVAQVVQFELNQLARARRPAGS
jgi:ABC-type cobalamin/Fe3+-siderophores transport system ATPase subunit